VTETADGRAISLGNSTQAARQAEADGTCTASSAPRARSFIA
jgi:hypothetical protein